MQSKLQPFSIQKKFSSEMLSKCFTTQWGVAKWKNWHFL